VFSLSFLIPKWPQPSRVRVPVSKPDLSGLERELLLEAFDSGWIGSNSGFVVDCEKAVSGIYGVQESVLVSNGSVAIVLALDALGIGEGDEVIVPALTYAATASSVVHVGAIPVFCDVDESSWQITAEQISGAYTSKTKAVIVPHTYGVPGDMKSIMSTAEKLGILVIEDCAESFGAEFEGSKVGTFGDAATFSFFPNKLLTSGEGGLVIAKDQRVLDKARLLRGQGMSPSHRYVFEVPGYNFRITGLQAAVLLGQLRRYSELWDSRQASESQLTSLLADYAVRPKGQYSFLRSPWIFSALLKTDLEWANLKVAEQLALRGIETRPVFWPLGQMKAFSKYRTVSDIVAQTISQKAISLPSGSHLTPEDASEIFEVVKAIS
jgi:perosamine synthetase